MARSIFDCMQTMANNRPKLNNQQLFLTYVGELNQEQYKIWLDKLFPPNTRQILMIGREKLRVNKI